MDEPDRIAPLQTKRDEDSQLIAHAVQLQLLLNKLEAVNKQIADL
jgi:hypothetical protein